MGTRRSLILNFSVFNFVNVAISWLIFVFLTIYLKNDLGFSEAKVGILISVFVYTMLFTLLPLGYLSDRMSPRMLIRVGVIAKAIHLFGISSTSSFTWLIVLQMVGGISETLMAVCLYSLFFKNLTAKGRGTAVGVFSGAAFLGYATGPWIRVGLEGLGLDYTGIFRIVAAASLLLLVMTIALKDSKPVAFHPIEYLRDIKRPEVLIMSILMIGVGVHFGVERKGLSLLISSVIGLDDFRIAVLFASLGVTNGILTFAMGSWFDRSKRMIYYMLLGTLISGGLQALTPFVSTFGQIIAVRTIHLFGDALVLFGLNILTASIFPQHRMGGSWGYMFMLEQFGVVLGASVAGILDVTWTSYRASFVFSGAMVIASGAAMVVGYKVMRTLRRSLTAEADNAAG